MAQHTWEYLKAPEQSEYLPQWTPYPGAAVTWTRASAEQLAEMHRTYLSAPKTAWIVTIPRRGFQSKVDASPQRPEPVSAVPDAPTGRKALRLRFKIRDKLQAIEDELIEAGYEHFVVATDRGSFHWTLTRKPAADWTEETQPASFRQNSSTRSGHKDPGSAPRRGSGSRRPGRA